MQLAVVRHRLSVSNLQNRPPLKNQPCTFDETSSVASWHGTIHKIVQGNEFHENLKEKL